VKHDSVRLLRRASQYGGYTDDPSKALFAEPEAVSADAQRELTARVHRQAHAAQLAQWELHRAEIERRIDWLYSQRFLRPVDGELQGLRRQLDKIEAKLRSG
jgi:hypothetical protein